MPSNFRSALLWLALLLPLPVVAQVTGRLTGSVVDQSGAPIPGATVNVYLPGSHTAVLTTSTSTEGLFSFNAVRPTLYDLAAESTGFSRFVMRNIKVDASRETSAGQIKLELQAVQQTIEVAALSQSVQTTNTEISTTVTQQQVQDLPVLDRQVSNLFLTQPGVTIGRGPAVINGLRTSAANVTYEGINVQDNFFRNNSLSYIPSKFTIEQVAELTVTTSNANASIGGGAAQVVQVAPSGTNQYHGNVYWYNRNNKFAANDWFNNAYGVEKPFLNQNQLGATLHGPVIKDKLLFYFNYEAFRNRQQTSQLRTILTPEARQGIFRYRSGGSQQQVNVLANRNVALNSYIKDLLDKVPAVGNTSERGDGLNTTGYRFNQSNNEDRDAITAKLDYVLSPRHTLTGTYVWNTDKVDRPDVDNAYNTKPAIANDIRSKLFSSAWRWTAKPNLTNEVRGGFFFSPGYFTSGQEYPAYMLGDVSQINVGATLMINNPYNTFLDQGRDTKTYSLQDNANWVHGRHNVYFGFQMQEVRSAVSNDAGMVPLYALGISASNTTGFTAADLPGISSSDLATANNLYTFLGGITSQKRQTFNITSRTSGYVGGAPNLRNFSYGTWAGYVQDNFRLLPRLTVNLGLRWDYYTRANERDSLALVPTVTNGDFVSALLSNATLDFAGKSVGRPYYNRDLNNFAPNVGFAWDVFGNGKTALRGGYSISYFNDDLIAGVRQNVTAAAGLSTNAADTNIVGSISSPPPIDTPAFSVPRLLSDNYAISRSTTLGMPDPNLRTPYVQQWSFGIEQEVKGSIVTVRYVGNHGTKLLRIIDYNQVNINSNGFLADFNRARSNGFLSQAQTGRFDPSYNSSVSGSQQLTVLPLTKVNLGNATVQQYIRQGEAGTLAGYLHTSNVNGPLNFFPNPNTLFAYSMGNFNNSSYNALQFDVRRRMKSGFGFQANYSFSKVMSDGSGDDQRRLEVAQDINNMQLERARAPFDLTHVFKANAVYELPFGHGKRWTAGPTLDRIIGGWKLSGMWGYQSGTPFSIFSARGTFNRQQSVPAAQNTANTNLTKGQLDQVVGFFMTGNGPMFIDPSVIGPDGRGVAGDGAAPFAGQVFFNPEAGTIGGLQRRYFSGPWNMQLDLSVLKAVRISERHSVEFRMEALNALNKPAFDVGNESSSAYVQNFNVNSSSFGRITGLANITTNSMRMLQFGLYYRF